MSKTCTSYHIKLTPLLSLYIHALKIMNDHGFSWETPSLQLSSLSFITNDVEEDF